MPPADMPSTKLPEAEKNKINDGTNAIRDIAMVWFHGTNPEEVSVAIFKAMATGNLETEDR